MAVTEKKRKKKHHDSSALKIPRLFAEKCCSAVNVMQCKHKFFLSFHSAQGGAGAKGHLGNTHKQMTAKIKVNTTILRHINFTRPVCVNYFFFLMTLMPCSVGSNPGWLGTSVQVRQLPFKLSQQHEDVHKHKTNQICQSSTFTGNMV